MTKLKQFNVSAGLGDMSPYSTQLNSHLLPILTMPHVLRDACFPVISLNHSERLVA